jgi:Mn2+/Fe2+ NRAMP family transporter
MVFYQQSATARKNMRPDAYTAARWDTAFGALLTQALTGAVLIAAAATLYAGARVTSLTSIGQVGEALSAALGQETGRLIFSLGVLGASLAAAIVASLALSWGVAEVLGPHRRAKSRAHPRLFDSPWFVALFVASLFGAAALAGVSDDLVGLNIAAQVANALLFPFVVGFLVVLASKTLAAPHRLHGAGLLATVVVATTVAAVGLAGVVAGLL